MIKSSFFNSGYSASFSSRATAPSTLRFRSVRYPSALRSITTQTFLQPHGCGKTISTSFLFVLGQEHAIVPDQFQVSPSRFHVFGFDLCLCAQKLEVKQSSIREADFECLPVGWIVDHVDEGDDLACSLSEIKPECRQPVPRTGLLPLPFVLVFDLLVGIEILLMTGPCVCAAHRSPPSVSIG